MADGQLKNTGKKPQRYISFDFVRGLGIMVMIFLHSAVFHYGDINSIDMDNLNPLLMIFYVLIMWGGMFGALSGAVNTISTIRRVEKSPNDKKLIFRATIYNNGVTGLLLIVLSYFYYMIVGPTNYDMESGSHNHSFGFIPGSIRTGAWYQVQTDRWFEQSSLAMVGWILIFLGVVFYFLFKNNGIQKAKRNQWVLFSLGSCMIFLSFLRIYIYPLVVSQIEGQNYLIGWLLAVVGYEPFPWLPYLGFGFLGAAYAIIIEQRSIKRLNSYYYASLGWILYFIICFLIPDPFYEQLGLLDDIFFMYLLIIFQVSLFMLLANLFVQRLDKLKSSKDGGNQEIIQKQLNRTKIFRQFGTTSLTIFLSERIISNLLARVLTWMIPGWNNSILTCVIFGLGNVGVWLLILWGWGKMGYRFSVEWWWVRLLKKLGKNTSKIIDGSPIK